MRREGCNNRKVKKGELKLLNLKNGIRKKREKGMNRKNRKPDTRLVISDSFLKKKTTISILYIRLKMIKNKFYSVKKHYHSFNFPYEPFFRA